MTDDALAAEAFPREPAFGARNSSALDIFAWRSGRFRGEPPPRRWLVTNSIPMAVAGLVVAQGDTGKSMMGVELGRRIAFGSTSLDPPIFGGTVERQGTAVILTSEDDEGEVHRRLAALDAANYRHTERGDRLIIVPLPSAGGSLPLFRLGPNGMEATDDFARLRDQLATIEDLQLVCADPLQAFVLGPINEDPAAGQYVSTEVGALAAELQATWLWSHHMKKAQKPVRSLQDARDLVRGTTALVDGVRFAFALWPAEDAEGRVICKAIGRRYLPGSVVRGGIIKANGPALRIVRTYIRNEVGLLIDETAALKVDPLEARDQLDGLVEAVRDAALRGQPFTRTGNGGLFAQRERLPDDVRALAKHAVVELADAALGYGRIVQAAAKGSKHAVWLDSPDGPFARGDGVFATGSVGSSGAA